MKRQLGPILAALALLCAPVAWAQTGYTDSVLSASSDPQNGSSDPSQAGSSDPSQMGSNDPLQTGSDDSSQASSSGPQSTFSHPEQLPPLSLLGEAAAHTGIRFDLTTGTVEEYVAGGARYNNYWQNLALFGAGVHITQIRPKLMWALGYNGGISLNSVTLSNANSYTTLNQGGSGRIVWKVAKRWQLRAKDNFLYTDNPFEPFLTYTQDPTPADPNPVVYIPQAVTEQNQGSLDLTYQLGKHDSIDFSGGESFQRFLRGASGLWDSFTYSGGAFYQHEISEQLSVGGGYSFSALDFGHGQSRAGVNMFEGFVSYRFNPFMSVSFWIGPELTNTKNLVPIFCTPYGCFIEEMHNSFWDVAEGGTFSWVARKNAMRAQFSHRVTDGGGVLGAVSLYQVSAGYSRPMARGWGFSSGILADKSSSVSHFRANQYLNSIQGTFGFTRKISDAWGANFYYVFIHQSQNYYGLPGTISTSGIGLTLRYGWGRSLGR